MTNRSNSCLTSFPCNFHLLLRLDHLTRVIHQKHTTAPARKYEWTSVFPSPSAIYSQITSSEPIISRVHCSNMGIHPIHLLCACQTCQEAKILIRAITFGVALGRKRADKMVFIIAKVKGYITEHHMTQAKQQENGPLCV